MKKSLHSRASALKIESYFEGFQKTIESCPVCRLTNLTFEKRSAHTGLIVAELTFIDESILQVREFIDVQSTVDRLMYAYHYMNSSRELLFRYDNTGHHKKLNLVTYPHHKHEGSEENVISAAPAEMKIVLAEIEEHVIK